MTDQTPTCCHIPDAHQGRLTPESTHADVRALACPGVAEYVVISGGGPCDYTEACAAHVGDLLTDAPLHTVVAIGPGWPHIG